MRFSNETGDLLELSVRGWEFPNEDWLLIGLDAHYAGESWRSLDPALMYEEALKLADWLENPLSDTSLKFLEPELEFRRNDGNLEIYLEWRLRPPSRPSNPEGGDRFFLRFRPKQNELRRQAQAWRTEVESVQLSRPPAAT